MTQDCSYNELYPLQVLDDSMEPEFPNHCVVVIEPSNVCANGAFVVAEIAGERCLRQYITHGKDDVRLVALKTDIPDILLRNTNFKIIGVVVQRNIGRKIKHYHPYTPNGEKPKKII